MNVQIPLPQWIKNIGKKPIIKGGNKSNYYPISYSGEKNISFLEKKQEFENYAKTKEAIFNKDLKLKTYSSNLPQGVVFKLQPVWYLYENMYMNIPAVASAVNKKSLAMGKLKSYFKDKDGAIDYKLTNDFNRLFRVDHLKQQISKQLDIFNTIIIIKKFQGNKKVPLFVAVPVSQTTNYFVDKTNFEIQSFSWNRSDIFSYDIIEKFNKDEPEGDNINFYTYTVPDVSDQFFGTPKLQAAFTKLDQLARDDANYQLFLKNSSFPGIIAFITGEQQDGLKGELESFFASMRDPDTKFKGAVIPNAVDSAGNPTVAFQQIKQSMENRLTYEEKREIDGEVFDALGLPRIIMGLSKSNSGIGANEYKPSMTMYKKDCLEPQANQIETIFKDFIVEEGLKEMKKLGMGKLYSHPLDEYEFELGSIDLADEEFEIKLQRGQDLYTKGIIRKDELKLKYLNYSAKEITEEDKVYNIPAQVTIVPAGELLDMANQAFGYPTKEKPAVPETKPEKENKPAELLPNIKPKHIYSVNKSVFGEEQIRAFKSNKNRERIKSFLEKSDKEKASKVPDLIKLPQAKDQTKAIAEALLSQYKSINLLKVLAELGIKKKVDTLQEDEIQQLATLINEELPKNEIDTTKLIGMLLFFARMGISNTEQLTGLNLEKEQKDAVIKGLNEFLSGRVDNLLNGLPEGQTPDPQDITNPYYDGSLDETTGIQIAVILYAIMHNNPSFNQAQVIAEFNKQAEAKTLERARIIVENNLAHTFNLAIYLTGLEMGSKGMMEWLHTTAKTPRNEHLELVGEVRLAKDFPVAPGVLINCQCSWTPKIDSPTKNQ